MKCPLQHLKSITIFILEGLLDCQWTIEKLSKIWPRKLMGQSMHKDHDVDIIGNEGHCND